jgi:chromatin remodeling complex protein RSC6
MTAKISALSSSDAAVAAHHVLKISCGEKEAQFHVAKFTAGGRSKCVFYRKQWVTPVELEEFCGRGASHNWKRTLKHSGKAVGVLIAQGKIKAPVDEKTVTAMLPDGEEGEKLYEALKLACMANITAAATGVTSRDKNVVTAPAAASGMSSKPQIPSALSASSLMANVADTDSDSGISVDSYTKALKIDVSGCNVDTPTPQRPHPPLVLSEEANAALKPTLAEAAAMLPSNTLLTPSTSPPPSAPDYTTMIQEALCSLSDSTSETGGCSQLNVLLYILNKYQHVEDGDVAVVHAKVRGALRFLSRMGIVQKCGDEAETDEEDFGTADMDTSAEAPAPSPVTSKTKKEKKKSSAALPLLKTSMKKTPKNNITCKSSSSSSPMSTAKKVVKSRPKQLSPALSAICGGRQMSRHEVVRQLWRYVKRKQLQDPSQKTTIICDEKLRAVTKRKRIPQTDMLGCLSKHLTDLKAE